MSKSTQIGLELFKQAYMGGSVSTEQVPANDYKAAQRALKEMAARGLLESIYGGDTRHRRYRLAPAVRFVQEKGNLTQEEKIFLCHTLYRSGDASPSLRISRADLLTRLFDDALPSHFYPLTDHDEQARSGEVLKTHAALAAAIEASVAVKLAYQKADGTFGHYTLQPHAILIDRYWDYLLAIDQNETKRSPVKTFRLDRIRQTTPLLRERFVKSAEIIADIGSAKSIYHFTQGVYRTVTLEISEELAESFRSITYFPFQEFTGFVNGRLRITTRIKRPEEILPDIKMLIPHIRIIDAPEIEAALARELRAYLDQSLL